MPRGARRNLRPVADRKSQPIARTSSGELPHGLAGIEEIEDAGLARDAPHLLGGVHEAGARRHVRERDELRAPVDPRAQGLDRDLPVRVIRHDDDLGAGALRDLKERDVVADVLGVAHEDAVTRTKGDRIEGEVPRARRAVGHGDLVCPCAEQSRDRGIDTIEVSAARRSSAS